MRPRHSTAGSPSPSAKTGRDPKARNRLWRYFERIDDEGTTIFLTTQYLAEADRLGVILDGAVWAVAVFALSRATSSDVQ